MTYDPSEDGIDPWRALESALAEAQRLQDALTQAEQALAMVDQLDGSSSRAVLLGVKGIARHYFDTKT